ncbi:hypothetical protein K502DRAFT_313977 [Neoconidiobolus thromboides FSU 785]|nr:hypothetical protein K502DRAFT_313977 [Neoconidiobolus thromboides FSU 785]
MTEFKEETASTECLTFDDKDASETGKFRFLVSLLKKLIGVADIINLRISLPSQVLDPIPNLEHFHWIDRPDYFASIDSSDDPVERMLNVARYCFSKDVHKAKNRVKKPYNSILGEYFLCSWDVNLVDNKDKKVKVTMINEQTSHHPPVSAFWYECKETGVIARGCDHLSAKFTGTAIKIVPGELGKGIYITLKNRDNEEYHITHCDAYLSGWLTGSFYLSLAGRVVISCPKTKLRIVYDYKPERWIGKSKYAIEGKLFEYEPTFNTYQTHSDVPNDNFKLSEVDNSKVFATLSGSWKEKIFVDRNNKEQHLLIDVSELEQINKQVKPMDEMDDLESRKVWNEVTKNILNKNYSIATKAKIEIEDRQRKLAKERKGTVWLPKYFKKVNKETEHYPQLNTDADIPY